MNQALKIPDTSTFFREHPQRRIVIYRVEGEERQFLVRGNPQRKWGSFGVRILLYLRYSNSWWIL